MCRRPDSLFMWFLNLLKEFNNHVQEAGFFVHVVPESTNGVQ